MKITIEDIHVGDVVRFAPDIYDGYDGIGNASEFADNEYVISAVYDEDGEYSTFTVEDDEDEWYWNPEIIDCIVSRIDDDEGCDFGTVSDLSAYFGDYE